MNGTASEQLQATPSEGRRLLRNVTLDSAKKKASQSPASTRLMFLLLFVFAIVWFGTLDFRKLIGSDEGRYAEIAREMVTTGDWVTPRYNGVKYFEKPILLYWTTAAAFSLFGQHEWTARLWVAVTSFAGVVLLFVTGRAIFSPSAGLLSAAILGSSALWVGAGHMNTTDMGLSFFLESTLCAFLLAFRPGISPQRSRGLMYLCWAAMGLAVLSKGLIGLVLPGLTLTTYILVTRDSGILLRLQWRHGLLIFATIAVPWFLLVSIRNPEFPGFFFLHEHFGRFTTVEGYNRAGPWWYFGAITAIGLLPWTLVLPSAIGRRNRNGDSKQQRNPGFNSTLLLWIWGTVTLVFFSVSKSKLPGYILPAFPALALLAGYAFTQMSRRDILVFLGGTLALATMALFGSRYIPLLAPAESVTVYRAYQRWIEIGVGVALLGALLALYMTVRATAADRKVIRALLVFAVFSHFAIQIVILGHDLFRGRSSAYDLARQINPRIDRTQPFYAVKTFDHTLPFYMQKTMTLVESRDELAFGLSLEPRLWVDSIPHFVSRWQQDAQPMALMRRDIYEQLKRKGLPMRIVAQDQNRIVVEKPR